MSTQKTPRASWNEIIFTGKNQFYGAYVLRNNYPGNVLTGFVAGSITLLLLLYAPQVWDLLSKESRVLPPTESKTIKYTELAPPPSIEKLPPPPTQVQEIKKMVKYLPPKVTVEEVVEENVPTVEEIKQNDTGPSNTKGSGNIVADTPPVEEGTGSGAEEVFSIVEEMPEYTGGMEAMGKYLSKNMRYPATARRMGVEGTVYVSFVVSKDGSISEVMVLKGIHADCDQEAVRVISKMPPWKPGKQRGAPVSVKFVLPIKFKLG